MSQSHLPPEEPRLSSEAPPQEGPTASQNPAPPAEDMAAQKAGKEKKPGAFGARPLRLAPGPHLCPGLYLDLLHLLRPRDRRGRPLHGPHPQRRDMLFLQCIAYEPKQGDVVVLHKDFGDVETPIVKRVIAVGGQTVEIDYDTGHSLRGRSAPGGGLHHGAHGPARRAPTCRGPTGRCPRGLSSSWGTTAITPPTAGTAAWARWTPGMCWGGPSARFSPSSTSAWWNKEVRPCDWTNG